MEVLAMRPEALGRMIQEMIQDAVRAELGRSLKTPADYRLDSSYPDINDLAEIVSREVPICVNQIRKYERGEITYLDSPNTARRICAIAERLKVPVLEYRTAIRRMMEARRTK
jgi:tRNA U54 and U55 pseudouridine synthase Pus10